MKSRGAVTAAHEVFGSKFSVRKRNKLNTDDKYCKS